MSRADGGADAGLAEQRGEPPHAGLIALPAERLAEGQTVAVQVRDVARGDHRGGLPGDAADDALGADAAPLGVAGVD